MIGLTALFVMHQRTSGSALYVVLLVVEGKSSLTCLGSYLKMSASFCYYLFCKSIVKLIRYKEGHTFRHWKDTQHCYSLSLETQRVWDYEGDNYVHRLNHSKADGKSAMVDSHCMSHDGDCGTCDHSEDSEMAGALYSSKVEAVCVLDVLCFNSLCGRYT